MLAGRGVTNDEASPRAGTALDLSRRMDRLEEKHDDLARTVASLTSTVTRIEANQTHAAELNKLRFDSLDIGLNAVKHELDGFMARIESIISGETVPASARQGQELVADYQRWRQTVEDRFDRQGLTIARWGGGIAVLVVLINIAAPLVVRALNLP